jgi:hypothetical protein
LKERKESEKIAAKIEAAWDNIKNARVEVENIKDELGELFGTEGEVSVFRFNANKPPK